MEAKEIQWICTKCNNDHPCQLSTKDKDPEEVTVPEDCPWSGSANWEEQIDD